MPTPLIVTKVEYYKDSRAISLDRQSVSQDIVLAIYGNFIEQAKLDTLNPSMYDGYNDDHEVVKWMYNNIPAFREFILPDGTSLFLQLASLKLNSIADDYWKIDLVYDVPEMPSNPGGNGNNPYDHPNELGPSKDEPDNSEYYTKVSFNTSIERVHKKQSLQVEHIATKPGITAPSLITINKAGPVGLLSDGSIEGYEAFESNFDFSITRFFTPEELTYKYVRRITRLTGKINLYKFFGFDRGQVLFLGAQGESDLFSIQPVTFNFSVKTNFSFIAGDPTASIMADPDSTSPIRNQDQIADSFNSTTNLFSGWDLVDYIWNEVADPAPNMILSTPDIRIVHRVCEYGDFDKLLL